MLKERQILILGALPKIGRKSIFKISEFLKAEISNDDEFRESILLWAVQNKMQQITADIYQKAVEVADNIIEKSNQSNIKIYGFWNPLFPDSYKLIKEPPVIIHVVGDVRILNEKRTVAIIGTREPSDYGFKAGRRLSEVLAMKGFVIVSGLAKGCDTSAHKGCLLGHGKTVAVLAHGLDIVYPSANKDLAFEIIQKGGALISEYPVGQKPFGNLFVERDRLQSGLSQATIVVETDIKGGTMHTVKFTEEENKFLACLYHPEKYRNHPKVNGNLMLIEQKRALPLGGAEDIQNLIQKIYDRIGYVEDKTYLPPELTFSNTLFDIDEYISHQPPDEEKPKKKRKQKSKDGVKQSFIIWE